MKTAEKSPVVESTGTDAHVMPWSAGFVIQMVALDWNAGGGEMAPVTVIGFFPWY